MDFVFFFQAEDGIRDAQESRGLGDVYKRQPSSWGALWGSSPASRRPCNLHGTGRKIASTTPLLGSQPGLGSGQSPRSRCWPRRGMAGGCLFYKSDDDGTEDSVYVVASGII
eukprot:TRINITY_DN37503_c0_g1_i2.p1 TRINITY_DN37503_c0_g1~~TRINITY_DN37503_c0_g1_i2.p1  ORF type:complete len:112 (-),score=12.25 TRINITY_DN37503_c0_g1_i2:26-361(-)